MLKKFNLMFIGNDSSFVVALRNYFGKEFGVVRNVFYRGPFSTLKMLRMFLVFIYNYLRSDVVFVDFTTTFAWVILKIRSVLPFNRPIIGRCHRFELFDCVSEGETN